MDSSTCIEQKGVVEDISNGLVKVNITSFSACANCHSRQSCGIIDSSNRELFVPFDSATGISIGETVGIVMKRTMGWKATILAYVIPFLLVLITLLVLNSLKLHEVVVGMGSLAVLAPYFAVMYFRREHLRNTFSFTIRKIV
jgi:sigma-E factor negative regulatory protein RseC